MFSIKYNTIDPFVTPQANVAFANIHADYYNNDVSMTATLRALLFERLNDKKFSFKYRYINQAPKRGVSVTKTIEQIFDAKANDNFVIADVANKDVFNECVNLLARKELAEKEGLIEDKLYADHMMEKAKLNIRAYINEEKMVCYILVEAMTMKWYRLIQSLIPRYFRKLFNDNPLKPEERSLLETLTRHSGQDYLNAIAKLGEKKELREMLLRGMVKDFEKREMETMLRKAQEKLSAYAREITNFMQQYSQAVTRHQDQLYRIEGIKARMEGKSDNSDLLNYLLRNPHVDIVRMEGSQLDVEVRTTMDIFDADAWQRFANKGEIFNNYTNLPKEFNDVNDRKLFLNNIFGEDGLLRLKFRGYYTLNLNGTAETYSRHTFKPCCDDYMTNPHLYYHACLGGNRTQISQQLTSGEIIGAIECSVASCKSVNMGEVTQTIRPLIRDVLQSNKKIIRTADGVDMTPVEALAWLKEKTKK